MNSALGTPLECTQTPLPRQREKGQPELAEIRRALRLLFEPGQVVELRILNTRVGTVSGYFDSMDKLARAALVWDGRVPAIYVTLNPVDPALLARAANRLQEHAKDTTQDRHIVRRRWIGFDFDPVRPSGISSSDTEHEAALERARQVRSWLRERGWPEPIFVDSGNGAHLLYRIDLPNDDEALRLVNRCLEAVAFVWEDGTVSIDQAVGNAARIWKLWGTMACKGDNTPDRPHRRSRILEAPERVDVVPRPLLEELASLCPPEPEPGQRNRQPESREPFDLEAWIRDHGLPVVASGPWGNGGWRWILNPCPWNLDHRNRAAYIVRLPNGAIAAGCHHNGCRGKGWPELRDAFEPAWRDRKAKTGAAKAKRAVGGGGHGEIAGEESVVRREPVLVRVADVEPEKIDWLWWPYIPRRKITLVEGDPDIGKTYFCLTLGAIVSRGWPFPDPRSGRPAGQGVVRDPEPVLYMSAEDDIGDTLRPRLDAAGADVTKVHALMGWAATTEKGEPLAGYVTLSDIPILEAALEQVRPALVVIDPLQGFLGASVDMHRANEVRPILARLAELAERYDCAILLVRHLSKAPTDRALYRGLGSIDITAAARSVLLVVEDPERPGEHGIIHLKSNLAEKGPAIGFKIDSGRFVWTGLSRLSRAVLWTHERIAEKNRTALQEAIDFLESALKQGPKPSKDLFQAAKEARIKEITLRRAKDKLGITAEWVPDARMWVWQLHTDQPQHALPQRHDDHLDQLAENATAASNPGSTIEMINDHLAAGSEKNQMIIDHLGSTGDKAHNANAFGRGDQDDHSTCMAQPAVAREREVVEV